jgi:hypothetical protein
MRPEPGILQSWGAAVPAVAVCRCAAMPPSLVPYPAISSPPSTFITFPVIQLAPG